MLALHPRCDFPWAGRLTCWGEKLQYRVKLSTQCCSITIQTLITHVYVRPCQAQTPGQCSPVSISAVRKLRLPLDVYILQTEGRMEGERERDRGERMTYSCSAPTQSPPRLSASGHGHNILWLTSWFRVDFIWGVCVYCAWMSEGQMKETYITCFRPAALLSQSTQTEHFQTMIVLLANNKRREIKNVVRFCVSGW